MNKNKYTAAAGLLGFGVLLYLLLALANYIYWEKRLIGTWGSEKMSGGHYGLRIRFNEDGTLKFRSLDENFDGYWKVTDRRKRRLYLGEQISPDGVSDVIVSFSGNKMYLRFALVKTELLEFERIGDEELEYGKGEF